MNEVNLRALESRMSSQKARYDATMRAFFTSIQYRYDRSVVIRKPRTDVFNLFGHSPRASCDCTYGIRPSEIWPLACVRTWSLKLRGVTCVRPKGTPSDAAKKRPESRVIYGLTENRRS